MSPAERHRPGLTAVVAAGAAIVAEIVLAAGRSALPPPSYIALCAGLALAAAIAVGWVASALSGKTAVAVALWTGVHAALHVPDGAMRAVVFGTFAGLAAGAACSLGGRSVGPAAAGWTAGAGTVAALGLGPHLLSAVGAWPVSVPARDALRLVAMFVAIGVPAVCCRSGRRSAPWVAAALLLAAVGSVPAARRSLAARDRPPRTEASRETAEAPSVLVLVLDTVRADHLSLYGHARDTTPRLRGFLDEHERAVLYPWVFAPAPWTLPSHASLFTGTMPSVHGAHGATRFSGGLSAQATLAERAAAAGYRTIAVFANPVLSTRPELQRGFDRYVVPDSPRPFVAAGEGLRQRLVPWLLAYAVEPAPPAAAVNAEVLAGLDACGARPCFVVANYMEAHAPYAPSPGHAGRFSDGYSGAPPLWVSGRQAPEVRAFAEARYDEEILSLDDALGSLLDEVERRGLLDRAWLVVTSDHGEGFGEHGLYQHGAGLYNEEVRIPLLVHPPAGVRLRAWNEAVSLLDVTATLSLVMGGQSLGVGRDLRGDPTAAAVGMELSEDPQRAFAALDVPQAARPARAVVVGWSKLIAYADASELYRLDEDPGETRDLAGELDDQVAALSRSLPDLAVAAGRAEPPALDPEQERLLRGLGYVGGP